MINLFSTAQNDDSLNYLATLFGNMYGIINGQPIGGGNIPSGTTTITLISQMFRVFNGVILTVGALIVVYVTVTGVMITAHEGEFMGKKYHQLWTPLRTVMGIAALIPTPTGYSGIQLIMMWVIVQGIGAADVLWDTVLKYVSYTGSPYAQITIPTADFSNTMRDLFGGLVCSAAAYHNNGALGDQGNYFCSKMGCGSGGSQADYDPQSPVFKVGPGGVCGTLRTCDLKTACADASSLGCQTCTKLTNYLQTAIPILTKVATNLVEKDYEYRVFYQTSASTKNYKAPQWIQDYCSNNNIEPCCVPPPSVNLFGKNITVPSYCQGTRNAALYSPNKDNDNTTPSPEAVAYIYYAWGNIFGEAETSNKDFIQTLVQGYASGMKTVVDDFVNKLNQTPITGALTDASNHGWIVAGSYYYIISQMNDDNANQAKPTTAFTPTATFFMQNSRNDQDAAKVFINMAAGFPPGPGSLGDITSAVGNGAGDVANSINTLKESQSNPITQMQQTGMALLIAVQVIFLLLLVGAFIGTFVAGLAGFAAGFGFITGGSQAEMILYIFIMPAVFAIFGLMITTGGLLAIYVPLIPYIVFTFGAIGWLITTLEAMVAGPLVALGILSPSGQHEIVGKAEPAIMLLFSIFLRPALMVFGLMAGMLLATVVAKMINDAYWGTVAAGIGGGGSTSQNQAAGKAGLLGLQGIIFIVVYVMIIVSAMNKCFSTIHVIPERVMAWISGQAAQTGGADEMLGEMKGGVSSTTSGAKGAMAGAKGPGGKGAPAGKGPARGKPTADMKTTPPDNQGGAPGAPT